ncbi:hypothetical protein BDD43_0159 [Mucilaginibacter gracilis]|uniref:Uncharacterized protein n=1 Tax=Mucilaginibacter gracilis TaxID=423350 RepID=A0A495ITH8_9SPHI|nr:hypothetical protein [Mucilaginibacter gracilis]RKR80067.1 hypothetical protein BDD43_0159 [Mucilaginibacter gracilis]
MVSIKLIKNALFRGLGGLLLLLCFSSAVKAQTFAEWWSQKSTQIKYLEQQIIAAQVYYGYLKQGYNISQKGLGVIGDWKNGELNLHKDYYNALKTVNPVIRNNPKLNAIAEYAGAIPGQFDHLQNLPGLTADNRAYINAVRKKVLAECSKDLQELELVAVNGKAEMTDDERLSRLDKLYDSMKDKFAFTVSYCNQVRTLFLQKQQQLQQIQTERRFYEIN